MTGHIRFDRSFLKHDLSTEGILMNIIGKTLKQRRKMQFALKYRLIQKNISSKHDSVSTTIYLA